MEGGKDKIRERKKGGGGREIRERGGERETTEGKTREPKSIKTRRTYYRLCTVMILLL